MGSVEVGRVATPLTTGTEPVPICVPLSKNFTVPVGVTPLMPGIDSVSVTVVPKVVGFGVAPSTGIAVSYTHLLVPVTVIVKAFGPPPK